MYIETEKTPNPLSIKFYPNCTVLTAGSVEFKREDDYSKSPLASRIFKIKGVAGVLLSSNFITVSKDEKSDWEMLEPQILGAIMEHFESSDSVVADDFFKRKAPNDNTDAETQIIDIIETRIRPILVRDGGDIEFHEFKDGIVYLYLKGACAGCPGAAITLKNSVEKVLKQFIPEVKGIKCLN